MKFSDIKRKSIKLFHKYLSEVSQLIKSGKISLLNGHLTYPNLILFSEYDQVFVIELIGCQKRFEGLRSQTVRCENFNEYFSHLNIENDKPTFTFSGSQSGLKSVIVTNQEDLSEVKSRFRVNLEEKIYTKIFTRGSNLVNFSFQEDFLSTFLDNCFIVNRIHGYVRMKHIQHALIIGKDITENAFMKITNTTLKKYSIENAQNTNQLLIVNFVRNSSDLTSIRSQFVNLISLRQVRETIIGDFLSKHIEMVRAAFSATRVLYEKEFNWIKGNRDPNEKSIRPDFLVETSPGLFDIVELKKPRWDRLDLTKGEQKRRRFVDYINEGVAQLANYEAYFSIKENQEHAQMRYGVRIENARLILIVGNLENMNSEKVEEALRTLKDNIFIIDYDTLNVLASNQLMEAT